MGIAVTALVLTAAFWKPAARSGAFQGREQLSGKIQIENRTQSIEVVSAERREGSVHISLKNNSNSAVDGLQMRVGDVAVETEFLDTDITFPAGSTHEETYPTQQDSTNRGIAILCATFEDGSSEGHPKYVKQIKDKRFGETMQTQRALVLIDQALTRSNVDTDNVEKLIRDISSLPVRDDDHNDNYDILLGLQDRKTLLLSQIEGVHRRQALTGTSGAQDLIKLKQRLNRNIKQ
jgi:hypothetical protein